MCLHLTRLIVNARCSIHGVEICSQSASACYSGFRARGFKYSLVNTVFHHEGRLVYCLCVVKKCLFHKSSHIIFSVLVVSEHELGGSRTLDVT